MVWRFFLKLSVLKKITQMKKKIAQSEKKKTLLWPIYFKKNTHRFFLLIYNLRIYIYIYKGINKIKHYLDNKLICLLFCSFFFSGYMVTLFVNRIFYHIFHQKYIMEYFINNFMINILLKYEQPYLWKIPSITFL